MYYVYLLICSDNSSYVGATINLDKRLRQHNKEISGGAIATTRKIKQGKIWTRVLHVCNFPDWSSALQFEWKFKFLSRKLSTNIYPLKKRLISLKELLSLDRPTSKSIPYSEWAEFPKIVFENEEAEKIYNSL